MTAAIDISFPLDEELFMDHRLNMSRLQKRYVNSRDCSDWLIGPRVRAAVMARSTSTDSKRRGDLLRQSVLELLEGLKVEVFTCLPIRSRANAEYRTTADVSASVALRSQDART